MARADHSRTGLIVRCAIYTRKSSDEGLEPSLPQDPKHADGTPHEFIEAFTQYLVSSQILVQALLAGMKSERFGRIINIVSTSVKQPIPGLGVSNTVRGAVALWAKTLAGELAP
jgi:NAD(P)-dependent dehydrogenase (short-subunit alcohol dehydrogenase family)